MGASFLVPVELAYGERLLGNFLFFCVMLVFAVAVGALGHAAYRRLNPAARYGVFPEMLRRWLGTRGPCGGR